MSLKGRFAQHLATLCIMVTGITVMRASLLWWGEPELPKNIKENINK